MNKIRGINIITNNEIRQYQAGVSGVTKIIDQSFSDQIQHHFRYQIIKGSNVVTEIINCPVEVFYYDE